MFVGGQKKKIDQAVDKMSEIKRGICPFYKYRPTNTAEILSCEATGEYIPVADSDSFNKFSTKIDETCLGFEYVQCPYYKKKIKELVKP